MIWVHAMYSVCRRCRRQCDSFNSAKLIVRMQSVECTPKEDWNDFLTLCWLPYKYITFEIENLSFFVANFVFYLRWAIRSQLREREKEKMYTMTTWYTKGADDEIFLEMHTWYLPAPRSWKLICARKIKILRLDLILFAYSTRIQSD